MTPQEAIVKAILSERERQDEKWGQQDHSPIEWCAILGEEYGEVCQEALRNHFGDKSLVSYYKEMAQVAAVAIAALECLGRGEWSDIAPSDPKERRKREGRERRT